MVDSCFFVLFTGFLQFSVSLMRVLGKHLLIDLWECRQGLDDVDSVRKVLVDAASASLASIIEVNAHQFSPQGVTGVAILAESHLAIHTWPEYNYVAADLFTCGHQAQPENAIAILQQHFQAAKVTTQILDRGIGVPVSGPSQ